MMSRMEEFCSKYSIDEEGKSEMLRILNESMVLISGEILKSVKVGNNKSSSSKEKSLSKGEKEGVKRYKSKKAEEYAMEHGIEIEEFDMMEISKKDVENLVREKTKSSSKIEGSGSSKEGSSSSKVESIVKKERVICSGINKKGEACKSTGTICPEGGKKRYCFRHAEDWKSFECESDSSESEEEKEELEEESYND
jgi:hypothetical protein